jgi:hypothetical protein
MKYTNALKREFNYTLTENGGLAHKTTNDALYDLFAQGAAYRTRNDTDCIFLFAKAFEENPTYAMKCLFYLRDILEGQGERRYFRTVINWLADNEVEAMRRNLKHIPEFGRWDDLYSLVGTPLEKEMWDFMYKQFRLDMASNIPSLLGKWLKSENTSSKESRALGTKTRQAFGMTSMAYRKCLSSLRKRINVLERLMSEGRWDEIEFDKIPSKAGMVYRNAFARHDVERMKAKKNVQSYADFAKDKTTKVNAKALYPYEVVAKAYNLTRDGRGGYNATRYVDLNDTERLMINKYWDNLAEYISKLNLNALCVVDTSGSMWGSAASAPINIAISLGMIAADKARGPFHGQYISFSSRPQLIQVEGVDFVDKVKRIYETNLCENTNLEATFDMLLNVAIRNHVRQHDLPKSIIVISDMQIDSQYGYNRGREAVRTMMENMRRKWARAGYQLPKMVYWCVDSRRDTFLDDGPDVTYVSGSSAVLFEQIAKGMTAQDLMFEKLDSKRYTCIE